MPLLKKSAAYTLVGISGAKEEIRLVLHVGDGEKGYSAGRKSPAHPLSPWGYNPRTG
ncbi:MAG: hypothetical protein ACOX0G_03670 [Patescibacteria group bacterium]